MIAIPAIDLREGACVQLVGGAYAAERIRLEDPVHVAREWQQHGFGRLHVVDLDAATGRGSNSTLVNAIVQAETARVQVGGGLRTTDQVREALALGARYVVLGTRALEDLDWLAEVADENPGEVILAADVKERRIVTRGWQRTMPRNVLDVVEEVASLPLGGLLVTAVHKEGRMLGADLALMEDVVECAGCPVLAAGGVGGMGDLWALEDRGVSGVVIGMALYTRAVDPRVVAEEFAQ